MWCVLMKYNLDVMLCLSAGCRQAIWKCCNSHLSGEAAALALRAFAYGNGRGERCVRLLLTGWRIPLSQITEEHLVSKQQPAVLREREREGELCRALPQRLCLMSLLLLPTRPSCEVQGTTEWRESVSDWRTDWVRIKREGERSRERERKS